MLKFPFLHADLTYRRTEKGNNARFEFLGAREMKVAIGRPEEFGEFYGPNYYSGLSFSLFIDDLSKEFAMNIRLSDFVNLLAPALKEYASAEPEPEFGEEISNIISLRPSEKSVAEIGCFEEAIKDFEQLQYSLDEALSVLRERVRATKK